MSPAIVSGLVVLAEGPSDGGGFTPTSVTPGLGGFVVMFLLAIVTVLLILDMTRRVRRIQARERVAQRHREASTLDGSSAHGGSSVQDARTRRDEKRDGSE